MNIISTVVILIVTVSLAVVFRKMIVAALKQLSFKQPLVVVAAIVFTTLVGALIFLISTLAISGSTNAGSVLGMILGITVILATFRFFGR